MRLKNRMLVLVLSVLLVLPGVLLSPALPAAAQTTSDLYGTGSADEINIVKLLDMALNKGGMSMSPATIKAFLEYWWSSVQADLSVCISNVDTSITGTQAFVDALDAALESADHYDQLGSIIKKYVRFVLTMDYKSLSDFKQLLLQPDTFRKFLLSYVTDEDGNIAGTVDNKIKRYNLKSGFVNMAREAAEAYIEEYEGYYLVKTHVVSDIVQTDYSYKFLYEYISDFMRDIPGDALFLLGHYINGKRYAIYDISDNVLVFNFLRNNKIVTLQYDENWASVSALHYLQIKYDYNNYTVTDPGFSLSQHDDWPTTNFSMVEISTSDIPYFYSDYEGWLYTSDGRSVKIWKSLDTYKAYNVGKSNVYYSSDYSKYDASVDNSIEFSGSYYSSNSSSYSHDIIQTTIDNSSAVNESTVNNIVNNYITNNNYGDSSGSGSGSGSGSSSGDWWNIGSGLESFIKGVAALLDFALKLLGDLISLLATFATSVLELLKSLSEIGTEFGDFLKVMFGFLPDECMSVIVLSIGLMCGVGLIKMFMGK